jgi:protein tyrosine phosphatase (PTP) superfamily phosphohydrolase (DUF442 family)
VPQGRTLAAIFGIVAAIACAVTALLVSHWDEWFWDHWDVVEHGVLYRSGQLKPAQLEAAIKRYGIRTVVSFLRPNEGVEAERALARRLGIDFMNLPMPGDGFGREEQFRAALAAIDDPERRPVLVHCARGTCRTGAMVALYRFENQGWTVADVAAEMRHQTYQQGWLPGYVYEMVDKRPFDELYEPRIAIDRSAARRTEDANVDRR